MEDSRLDLIQRNAIQQRATERETFSKEERFQRIQDMRARLNGEVARKSREVRTISENTKNMLREKAQEIKAQTQQQEVSREAPAR